MSRRPLLVILATAVLGGAVALGLGLATGALRTGATTNTVVRTQTAPANGAVAQLGRGWSRLYAATAPGTVAITVRTAATVQTPFGPSQERGVALGSGLVLDARGDVLTAAHVVAEARSIEVGFLGGATRSARRIGSDASADLAVIRVDPAGLTLHPLTLGSSRALVVGDPLAVIGSGLGFERSLSTGVVSGLDRSIQAPSGFTVSHAIQTDAAMNPGNSGGPLLDTRGEVIGIADQIATGSGQSGSTTATSSGVGFAVPSDLARAELARLERGVTVRHAYLGVSTESATAAGTRGAVVGSVEAGAPAARAGMRTGDVIVAVDGRPVRSSGDLIAAVAQAQPGQQVAVTVLRGGSRRTLTVTLTTQPARAPSR